MNIKTLTLTALLASATTMSFAEVSINENQQPASEAAPIVVSDQEQAETTPATAEQEQPVQAE